MTHLRSLVGKRAHDKHLMIMVMLTVIMTKRTRLFAKYLILYFVTANFKTTSIRLRRFIVGIVCFIPTFPFRGRSLGYSNVLTKGDRLVRT